MYGSVGFAVLCRFSLLIARSDVGSMDVKETPLNISEGLPTHTKIVSDNIPSGGSFKGLEQTLHRWTGTLLAFMVTQPLSF